MSVSRFRAALPHLAANLGCEVVRHDGVVGEALADRDAIEIRLRLPSSLAEVLVIESKQMLAGADPVVAIVEAGRGRLFDLVADHMRANGWDPQAWLASSRSGA